MAGTTRSSLGQSGVNPPKSRLQGSSTKAHTSKPSVQKSNGGFMAPVANKSRRVAPANSGGRGVGGSGNGPGKGNALPR